VIRPVKKPRARLANASADAQRGDDACLMKRAIRSEWDRSSGMEITASGEPDQLDPTVGS